MGSGRVKVLTLVKLYDEPELGSDVGANRQCAQQGWVTRYFEFWTYYRQTGNYAHQIASGIARQHRVVSLDLPWNQYDRASTGIAWSEVEARP
jgi:hypothetical protein